MITILAKSGKGNLVNFRSLRWKSSNEQPDNPTETFWILRTNFRLQTLIEHWKFKWFLGNLNDVELRALIDFPSVLRDEKFVALLRAKLTSVPSEDLLKRYNFLQDLVGEKPWTIESYFAREGDLKYDMREIRKPIRKVKKYSGYIKSPSALRGTRGNLVIPDPEIVEWSTIEDIDYYDFLTVGRFSGTSMEIKLPSLKRPARPKRSKTL